VSTRHSVVDSTEEFSIIVAVGGVGGESSTSNNPGGFGTGEGGSATRSNSVFGTGGGGGSSVSALGVSDNHFFCSWVPTATIYN
jgi:hypothetical protein